MAYTGRKRITTAVDSITKDNVVQELQKALNTHNVNSAEIEYLYNYYKGQQPVLNREKVVRPEIKNNVVVNRANEIVTFKTAYQVGEPVQYVCRVDDAEQSEQVQKLNEYMFAEDKDSKDQQLVEWFMICGQAYRMVLPDETDELDEAPFEIYTLDPRYTFVVYRADIQNTPLMGVTYVKQEDNLTRYSIYTKDSYFEIVDGILQEDKTDEHALGCIPIFEYDCNNSRLGAFEPVLPLLDSINNVASNRMDAVEQFVQALLVFKGVDIHQEDMETLPEKGAVKIPMGTDVEYLVQELNQMQTQVLTDDMYQTVLTICGMPNRNGGTSTSDTGKAVIMRDGWTAAEARAKDIEKMFKVSEKAFLRLCIRLSNTMRPMQLKLSSLEIRFTRRNYENMLEKAQTLTMLLDNPLIHPRLAYIWSNICTDPETAYIESMKYYKEEKSLDKEEKSVIMVDETNDGETTVEDTEKVEQNGFKR